MAGFTARTEIFGLSLPYLPECSGSDPGLLLVERGCTLAVDVYQRPKLCLDRLRQRLFCVNRMLVFYLCAKPPDQILDPCTP